MSLLPREHSTTVGIYMNACEELPSAQAAYR
jgi:hypothetical protein